MYEDYGIDDYYSDQFEMMRDEGYDDFIAEQQSDEFEPPEWYEDAA